MPTEPGPIRGHRRGAPRPGARPRLAGERLPPLVRPEGRGSAASHRIGHEPSAGITALWCGVVTRDGTRFRRSQAISYRPEDRLPDGFAGRADPAADLRSPAPPPGEGGRAASSTSSSPTSTPAPTSSPRTPRSRRSSPPTTSRRRAGSPAPPCSAAPPTRSTGSATGTTAGASGGGTRCSPTDGCRARSGRRCRSVRSPGTPSTAACCRSATWCATGRSATPRSTSSSTWRPTP